MYFLSACQVKDLIAVRAVPVKSARAEASKRNADGRNS